MTRQPHSKSTPGDTKLPQTTFTLLRGRLTLSQPEKGYRSGIDPLFLAAAVPAQDGDHVLELGTGVGTALLALAYRKKNLRGTGLEMQRDLVRIASENIQRNALSDRIDAMTGDLTAPPPRLAASSFCHVFSNPPYFLETQSVKSGNAVKAKSNHESTASLKQWITFAARMVKPKGSVTIIFTAERIDELICHMSETLGSIEIFPLWSKNGTLAKRVIVRGWKNKKNPSKLHPGLIVHDQAGNYTREALSILEDGLALDGWA